MSSCNSGTTQAGEKLVSDGCLLIVITFDLHLNVMKIVTPWRGYL